jgi:RluA family pseudouridine synthase
MPAEPHVVPPGTERLRLDKYASQVLPGLPSRARARKAAKAGTLRLNGKIAESSRFVQPGDTLTYSGPKRGPPKPYPRELVIPWVDDHLAVVVKPAGLLTNGNRFQTLEAILVHHLKPPDLPDALPWPRPAHRLDFRTGGLLVAARTTSAQIALGRAFEERRVRKRYRAIVQGHLKGSGTVNEPVEGRDAESRWEVVDHCPSTRVGSLTTVDLWPHTGRTHQLRRHMAFLGTPILGDEKYTPEDLPLLRGKSLFLYAVALTLPHPITGQEIAIEVPEPARFSSLRRRETARFERASAADNPTPPPDPSSHS